MYLRVLIQCWFALLAVVLPSQVFAYALESEASSACPEASISTNPILESDWLLSSAPQPAIPSSQSHVSHSAYAILNHSRHAPTQRLLVGCGSDLPLDADLMSPIRHFSQSAAFCYNDRLLQPKLRLFHLLSPTCGLERE